jgi:hypothetical protein
MQRALRLSHRPIAAVARFAERRDALVSRPGCGYSERFIHTRGRMTEAVRGERAATAWRTR